MIRISVDEGYAFDMLAIAEVKTKKLNLEDKRYGPVFAHFCKILFDIGHELSDTHILAKIIASPEYQELKRVNSDLFDLIDKLKKENGEECYDKRVDMLNYSRFLLKKKLQERFFPETQVSEQKIGYDKA